MDEYFYFQINILKTNFLCTYFFNWEYENCGKYFDEYESWKENVSCVGPL